MPTTERRREVLRGIVVEHVRTTEPVSSKTVAHRYVPQVSSATIRNDMAILEKDGLIVQPHTSAGRIPTEAGYRAFVDGLGPTELLAGAQSRGVAADLALADDFDDAIQKAVRALSRLAQQAAVVEYPDLALTSIHRVELVPLPAGRVLVLLVSSTGRVVERPVTLGADKDWVPTGDDLDAMKRTLNALLAGEAGSVVRRRLEVLEQSFPPVQAQVVRAVGDVIGELLAPLTPSKIATAGVAHLARVGIDLTDVAEVLELLDEQATLLRVLEDVHTQPVQVTIGTENKHEQLSATSLVSATYDVPSPGASHLGVIGPTRMDYARSLAAVETVAQCLSGLLLRQLGEGDSTA